MNIRSITPNDNAAVAHVIRTVMPEFNCDGEGFSIHDPEVSQMAEVYSEPRSGYFVIEQVTEKDAAIVGGAGFAPLKGGDGQTCELRKMYILQEGRGHGGGRLLMDKCLEGARAAGFTQMYLETVRAMTDAAEVYKKYGFKYLEEPMGNTGHGGCDRYMLRKL